MDRSMNLSTFKVELIVIIKYSTKSRGLMDKQHQLLINWNQPGAVWNTLCGLSSASRVAMGCLFSLYKWKLETKCLTGETRPSL